MGEAAEVGGKSKFKLSTSTTLRRSKSFRRASARSFRGGGKNTGVICSWQFLFGKFVT